MHYTERLYGVAAKARRFRARVIQGLASWPLSRKSYPKQFAQLVGDTTLFQASATRLSGPGYGAPVVVTNSDFRFIVTEQLTEIGIDPGAILIEPEGRNTAPAVLAAALHLHAQDADAVMLISPSDHVVPDAAAFRAAVDAGLAEAQAGQLVTFGITPTHPETGYGYLELESSPDGTPAPLTRFVEKPDAETAAELVASGRHLWNAGIFLFRADAILKAFRAHAPELMAPVEQAVNEAKPDLGFLRLAPEPWGGADNISIDYAVMERADNLSVVPYSAGWSDLGGWDAVWRESGQDDRGVALSGPATAIDCDNRWRMPRGPKMSSWR